MVLHFMGKLNKVVPKKRRGRPATGRDPVTAIRLSTELRQNVDIWAAKQRDLPGRSEAIRRLVEIALKARPRAGPVRSTPNKRRAAELAAKAIGMLVDVSTSAEEINRRRQRLTNGPTEFREDRVDLPKAKK
jgi:hypothetical protein